MSYADVLVRSEGSRGSASGSKSAIPDHANSLGTVELQAMATDRHVKEQLGDLQARVLQLADPASAFCLFENSTAGQAFDRRMEKALAASCYFCATGTQPGRRRECDVGFDLPKGTTGSDCRALRNANWKERFEQVAETHKALP
jgi:hypothetical protein